MGVGGGVWLRPVGIFFVVFEAARAWRSGASSLWCFCGVYGRKNAVLLIYDRCGSLIGSRALWPRFQNVQNGQKMIFSLVPPLYYSTQGL